MSDKELIDTIKITYKAKDLTELALMINIPYITLAKWNASGAIPKSGTGKQYLELLLKYKNLEEENKTYRDFGATLSVLLEKTKT